jgi:hypothetical protein
MFLQVFVDLKNYAKTRFRSRLREMPNGTWQHIAFLDITAWITKLSRRTGDVQGRRQLDLRFQAVIDAIPSADQLRFARVERGVLNAVLLSSA